MLVRLPFFTFMKKHIIIFLIALATTISATAYDFTDSGLYYNITGEGTCEVTYRTKPSQPYYNGKINATIPATVSYNGKSYTVTAIGQSAFDYCQSLKSIVLPNTVTVIGNNAFAECSNLTSITLPAGLATIEYQSFYNCTNLANIILPSSLKTIERGAFYLCKSPSSRLRSMPIK